MELVEKMLGGDVLSLARLISLVENSNSDTTSIMKLVYPHLGETYCIGITGPPGAGKSTTVDRLTAVIRQQGLTVGIICADPSSPFTGGAVLGDRIRMQQHYLDEGVFIRSMATRGSHGGLPESTNNVIKLLNAFGKDIILVETVGVGQTELDIMRNADTTIVVLTPESGDTIQTMKAGLFEIADIFAVNKSDRPGSDNMIAELTNMINLHSNQEVWHTPVIATEAVNNVGIEELYGYVENHRKMLEETGQLAQRRKEQRRQEFIETIERSIKDKLLTIIQQDKALNKYIGLVENAEIDPYTAANTVLQSAKFPVNWTIQSSSETSNKPKKEVI